MKFIKTSILILLYFFIINKSVFSTILNYEIKSSKYKPYLSYADIYINNIFIIRYWQKSNYIKKDIKFFKEKFFKSLKTNKNINLSYKVNRYNGIIYINNIAFLYINSITARYNKNYLYYQTKQAYLNLSNALLYKKFISFTQEQKTIPIKKKIKIKFTNTTENKPQIIFNKDLIDCKIENNRQIVVYAKQVCDTKLIIKAGDCQDILNLKIREYAGRIKNKNIFIKVSCRNLNIKNIKNFILEEVKKNIEKKIDAKINLVIKKVNNSHLKAKVKISGPLYIPLNDTINIYIKNLKLNFKNIYDNIYISNNPENIKSTGTIFKNKINSNKNNVLIFDHINKTSEDIYLIGYIKNRTNKKVEVALHKDIFKPSKKVLLTGQKLTEKLLKNNIKNDIYKIIQLQQDESYKLFIKKIKPLENITGYIFIKPLSNPYNKYLDLWIEARKKEDLFKLIIKKHKKSTYNRVSNIFKKPYIKIKKEININSENKTIYKSIKIGSKNKEKYGDYGHIYKIDIKLNNYTNKEVKLYFYFKASSGISKFIYILDNQLIKTPDLYPNNNYLLMTVKLPAKKEYNIKLTTSPVFNYYYPAILIITNKKI